MTINNEKIKEKLEKNLIKAINKYNDKIDKNLKNKKLPKINTTNTIKDNSADV